MRFKVIVLLRVLVAEISVVFKSLNLLNITLFKDSKLIIK
jgi:hypothetical protein